MHIIECYFNCGFDYKLIRGGIDVYIWNLVKNLHKLGHKTSIIMPTHGQINYLKEKYQVKLLDLEIEYELPLVLDQKVWKNFNCQEKLSLKTQVYQISHEQIDIYLLSNDYLNLYPESFYPPYSIKGKELSFFKPLVFQVDLILFIRNYFKNNKLIIHAHEPFYQYLLPIAFKDAPEKIVVSTVQSNMPVNKKIYKPKLEKLLTFLNCQIDLTAFDEDNHTDDLFLKCIKEYLPLTHLFYDYPSKDYINFYALILEYSDLIDFLSPGQRYFYTTFKDTPFQQLFEQLKVAQYAKKNFHKTFIGWCAIGDHWLESDQKPLPQQEKDNLLQKLGLKPGRPTFFHNARYAVEHKGQVELIKAIDRVLNKNKNANFIIRCLSPGGIDQPYFHEVAQRHAGQIYLEWEVQEEAILIQYVKASDFCLFPSKFEMDTFLIAQGEAMLNGLVPIATRQEGMKHWNHARPLADDDATGLSLIRSFAEDDPLLMADLEKNILLAIDIFNQNRELYNKLAANAQKLARTFTWQHCAKAHLEYFEKADQKIMLSTSVQESIDNNQIALLDHKSRHSHQEQIKEKLFNEGEALLYLEWFTAGQTTLKALFEQAFELGRFDQCRQMAARFQDQALQQQLANRMTLKHENQVLEITYQFPKAARIHVFVRQTDFGGFVLPQKSRDFNTFKMLEMKREPNNFKASFKVKHALSSLFFLLTLESGRSIWDASYDQ